MTTFQRSKNNYYLFYKRLNTSHHKIFSFNLLIYTVCFLVFFGFTIFLTIIQTGTLLAGDGILQYNSMLIDFRTTLLDFFKHLSDGNINIRMVSFDYIFGSDVFTTSTILFLPFFPLYALVIFIPEKSVSLFFAVIISIITYLCGITFIRMCYYFKATTLWSSFFAITYVFCGSFFYAEVWNPQFLYMMFIFPVLIIGIDKILHDKSGLALSFGVFFLTICFFYFLLYVIPFIVVFAAIRLYYVKKEKYFRNLLKYSVRGTLYVLLGVTLASFSFLPYLYIFFNGIRTVNTDLNILPTLIPSAKYITEMLFPSSIQNSTGICPVTVPFIILYALSPRSKKEYKLYLLAMIFLVSMPFIRYGLNAFQYDLCRWGFISACLCSFISIKCISIISTITKKETILFLIFSLLYVAAFITHTEIIWTICIIITSIFLSVPFLKNILYSIFSKFSNQLIDPFCKYIKVLIKKSGAHNSVKDIIKLIPVIISAVSIILLIIATVMFPNIPLKFILSFFIISISIVLIFFKKGLLSKKNCNCSGLRFSLK